MHWTLWIVVGWFVLSSLALVSQIGKERKPLTAGTAVVSLIMSGALVALIFIGGNA